MADRLIMQFHPTSLVRLSAFLGHEQDEVIATLVRHGMPSDEATKLVAREYERRQQIDDEDARNDEFDVH